MNIKEEMLYKYLMNGHRGRDNAVHSKAIEKDLGLSNRSVRTYISSLRKAGEPICSSEKGYWIASSPQEINGTVKRLGVFSREVDNARTGLAYATIQMRRRTFVREESIEVTVKIK